MDDESFMEIDRLGNKNWKNKTGLWHRLDGPAIERHADGSKYWYQDGVLHRLDGPAVERDLRKEWWFCGEKHRLDGPAVECANGDKLWYQNGRIHRIDGPAIIHSDGYKGWFKNGTRFKNKDTFFRALNKKEKAAALFSQDFFNG
jgi:hypothetical protein